MLWVVKREAPGHGLRVSGDTGVRNRCREVSCAVTYYGNHMVRGGGGLCQRHVGKSRGMTTDRSEMEP